MQSISTRSGRVVNHIGFEPLPTGVSFSTPSRGHRWQHHHSYNIRHFPNYPDLRD